MQKNFYLLTIIFLLFISSCSDKKVQLPKIELEGIPQIHNHSSIWVFYEIKNQDTIAILNKNNKIMNTNWIFNIDKRLTMNKVSPILIELQLNKNKPSMHKKEGTFSYFSYADLSSNQISVLNFIPTAFIFTSEEYQNLLISSPNFKTVELEIKKDFLILDKEEINTDQLAQKISRLKQNDTINSLKIFLKYNENITYQSYLKAKVFLNKVEIQIDSTEYIYSLK